MQKITDTVKEAIYLADKKPEVALTVPLVGSSS